MLPSTMSEQHCKQRPPQIHKRIPSTDSMSQLSMNSSNTTEMNELAVTRSPHSLKTVSSYPGTLIIPRTLTLHPSRQYVPRRKIQLLGRSRTIIHFIGMALGVLSLAGNVWTVYTILEKDTTSSATSSGLRSKAFPPISELSINLPDNQKIRRVVDKIHLDQEKRPHDASPSNATKKDDFALDKPDVLPPVVSQSTIKGASILNASPEETAKKGKMIHDKQIINLNLISPTTTTTTTDNVGSTFNTSSVGGDATKKDKSSLKNRVTDNPTKNFSSGVTDLNIKDDTSSNRKKHKKIHRSEWNPEWKAVQNIDIENVSTRFPEDYARLKAFDESRESNNMTFSACLLVMDENHHLAEWLAYHYFLLPLRHVVIATDPRSRTSPKSILDKWRPLINITEWTDHDFGFENEYFKANGTDVETRTKLHRLRQAIFARECSLKMKEMGRRWTTFIDLDEYLSIDQDFVNDTEKRMGEPGSIVDFIHEVRATQPNYTNFQFPCITIPRTTWGTVESTPEQVHNGVPAFVDPYRFETLRYRHRAKHGETKSYTAKRMVLNGPVKSIIDAAYAYPATKKKSYGTHVVFQRAGKHGSKYASHELLHIHHYTGRWEYYTARDDARRGDDRTRERWEFKANVTQVMNDDEVRPWIQGFVNFVGEPMAEYLLEDVGKMTKSNLTDGLWTDSAVALAGSDAHKTNYTKLSLVNLLNRAQ